MRLTPEQGLRGAAWIAAGLCLLIGLVNMMAWWLGWVALLQVVPNAPPMRFNAALMLALSGVSLVMVQRRRLCPWAVVPGGLVLVLGGLTLAQYLLNVDLGVDQLFVQDYLVQRLYDSGQVPGDASRVPVQQFFIIVNRPIPGRPSSNSAIAFTLAGMALVALGWPCLGRSHHRNRSGVDRSALPPSPRATALAGILAAIITTIGLMTLLGYAVQLSPLYAWRYLTGSSIPSATGFLCLGLGLISTALGRSPPHTMPQWFPPSLGLGVLMISLFLREALLSWNRNFEYHQPELAPEVTPLIVPIATVLLLQGIFLGLLVMGVLYFDQGIKTKARQLQGLNADLAAAHATLADTLEEMRWQAGHDPLTGLANRRYFEHCLEQVVATLQPGHTSHALCYLDLDHFKPVNDTCGHRAGDELLRQVTAILQANLRKADLLARLGGDEFGVLLYGCDLDQAVQLAHTLCQALNQSPFVWDHHQFTISLSIGVVSICPPAPSFEQVLIAADAACYDAKRQGRNRVCTATPLA